MQLIEHMDDGRVKVSTINEEPSLTDQQWADEVDVNVIMARYSKTGVWNGRPNNGQYADLTSITDYRTSLDKIMKAQEAFDQLDARIRNRFENDPAQLIDFLRDEKNKAEAQELGLINPEPPPAAVNATTNDANKPAV